MSEAEAEPEERVGETTNRPEHAHWHIDGTVPITTNERD